MTITPYNMISEIQKEFSTQFPHLRLEFFFHKPSVRSRSDFSNAILLDHRVGEWKKITGDMTLAICEDMKVKDLEMEFKKCFGLDVQVFRHSGNIWLQTTMTNDWTLNQQNSQGREISYALIGHDIKK